MGLYTREEEVKVRLIGKVRFTDSEEDENKMSNRLLRRLISEAEGQVETDLSCRYLAPFQTDAGQPFDALPNRPTKEMIRTLCELMSVIRVLETDFGSGSAVDSSKYSEKLEGRYKKLKDQLIERKEIAGMITGQWVLPPMPSLRLNYQNTEGDDGYSGQVLLTSDMDGIGDYPQKQINSPGETVWTGNINTDHKRDVD